MTEPFTELAAKGHVISQDDLNIMLDEYYKVRDWDLKTDISTIEKLVELRLEYVVEDLKGKQDGIQ
jgi:hypothetical protein